MAIRKQYKPANWGVLKDLNEQMRDHDAPSKQKALSPLELKNLVRELKSDLRGQQSRSPQTIHNSRNFVFKKVSWK